MKESRHGGDGEWFHGSKYSRRALEQFVYTNMPPEAERALDDRAVTPTVNEFLRLAGIEIDGQPPLAIEELIGPTSFSELDRRTQAFYFSGPGHPILVKARKSPTFVTYEDILGVHGKLGIPKAVATKNFAGLLSELYEDDAIPTLGKVDNVSSQEDHSRYSYLHRFAIRRKMAEMAMRGEYRVGISGTRGANTFNGYGRALIRAIYDAHENESRMELIMRLESMPDLAVMHGDPGTFRWGWGDGYKDSTGMQYRMYPYGDGRPLHDYVSSLLVDVGAIKPRDRHSEIVVSENGFVEAVTALCPMGKSHKDTVKIGEVCMDGVHYAGLKQKPIQTAMSIANCIIEAGQTEVNIEDSNVDETNLLDPGFAEPHSGRTRIPRAPKMPSPDWD